MADRNNDHERDELFRCIYKIATDLVHAGHVAEWDFKSYVLGTMFYRYISENFTAYINEGEHAAGNKDFDYAKMSDADAEPAREDLIQVKGFFILPSELFCNVLARADKDDNLNETLERVFNHIESSAASGDAENDFAGLFDDFDVNSKAIGETVAKRNKVLVELLNGVAQMPLFSADGINPDMFGDAYEYLMGMYAANAGKKGGQYFTPADVSELLARLGTIGKTKVNKVYDPACGSGSLLLKVEKVLGKENIEPLRLERLELRNALQEKRDFSHEMFRYAKAFAEADEILIAAPFWDLAFPAILRNYIENICVQGLTFYYTEEGFPVSLCRAKKLVYVMTAGGPTEGMDFGFPYVDTLCRVFFGIEEIACFKAEMLDVIGVDAEGALRKAAEEIDHSDFF